MSAPTLAAPNRARFAPPNSLPRIEFTGKLTHPARQTPLFAIPSEEPVRAGMSLVTSGLASTFPARLFTSE
jgi:hypothetical protein